MSHFAAIPNLYSFQTVGTQIGLSRETRRPAGLTESENWRSHRTIRILFPDEGYQTAPHLEHLVSMGCSYEGANKRLFAINLPPQVDLDEVCDYLTESEVNWEYVDPTYPDLFPEL